jgi:hypothetical protein
MDRRAFITIVGGCIPSVPRVAGAQAGAKTKVIGVLSLTSPDTSAHLAKAGADALRELGADDALFAGLTDESPCVVAYCASALSRRKSPLLRQLPAGLLARSETVLVAFSGS